ncbi:hypothetical protein [Emcibacter sp.]|uniref:hypothetical protein n=1 Tax=Emcibacter sp. TaxID=1979954 RepID=UPI002AA7CEE7|nr:hypothetical protein [Emcibacter sp.]
MTKTTSSTSISQKIIIGIILAVSVGSIDYTAGHLFYARYLLASWILTYLMIKLYAGQYTLSIASILTDLKSEIGGKNGA